MAAPEKWWVIKRVTSARSGQQLEAVESPTRPPTTSQSTTVAGPLPSKAAAEKWIAATEAGPVKVKLPDIDLPHIPNPLSGIGAVGHWLGEAVLHIIDAPMWRSLGWIVLGALLVIAGIYLWFRTSATYKDLESSITGAVKAL